MPRFKTIVLKIYATLLGRQIIRRSLSQLDQLKSPLADSLTEALSAVFLGQLTEKESNVIKDIENLRKALLKDNTRLSIHDFGAGTGGEVRHKGQVSGNVLTTTIRRQAMVGKFGIWALLLFKLIRQFKPKVCLELGTNLGFSAAYQAAALKLNGTGRLLTLEGAEALSAIAKENFLKLQLNNVEVITGRFQNTLEAVLRSSGPIDYAFIDGHHDRQATIHYFQQISSRVSGKAILVFDDISWSQGMRQAWQAVKRDSRVGISVDLGIVGLCVMS